MSPSRKLHPDFGPSFGAQPAPYGIPITVVTGSHAKVRVQFQYASESDDAAGLPILPGLLRYEEVAARNIDHAIRFTTDITGKLFCGRRDIRRALSTTRVFHLWGRASDLRPLM